MYQLDNIRLFELPDLVDDTGCRDEGLLESSGSQLSMTVGQRKNLNFEKLIGKEISRRDAGLIRLQLIRLLKAGVLLKYLAERGALSGRIVGSVNSR